MLEKVNEDIKNAMKARDKSKLDALRMLKSSFIENNTAKKPRELADVAIAHVKKLRDSLDSYPEGSDECEKIKSEIDCLSDYVPQPLAKDDVIILVNKILSENENANFGIVMKALSPQIKGRYDGKEASQLVRELLSS